MTPRLRVSGAVALVVSSTLAQAESLPHSEEQPWLVELNIASSTSPSEPDISAFGMSAAGKLRYQVDSELSQSASWGVSYVDLNSLALSADAVTPANPLLGVWYSPSGQPPQNSPLAFGFRAGAPIATFPGGIENNRLAEFNLSVAASTRGWRDPLLWIMNTVPVALYARAAFPISSRLTLATQLAPVAVVSVNQRPSRAALSAEAELRWQAIVSPRLGWTYFLSGLPLENQHLDQQSVWLGASMHADSHQLHAHIHLNVDEPNGVTSEKPGTFWGVTLGGELAF